MCRETLWAGVYLYFGQGCFHQKLQFYPQPLKESLIFIFTVMKSVHCIQRVALQGSSKASVTA